MKESLLTLAFLVLTVSCKKDGSSSDSCNGATCTTDFRTVTVYLTDGSGPAHAIDSIRVLGPDGQPTRVQNTVYPGPGHYAVASDDWVRTDPKAALSFRVKVFQNGQPVVDTPYQVGTDCCHVFKISGPDTIRIR
ncbi:MAG: hypothetical protein EOP52_12700 [Sphingobacteriales bacterium]|nr:MAG: hypothetical protein EOP52_12700 [Sphingobacteriales bacterium]